MSEICVYIPTYHRPLALCRCLSSVIDECIRYGDTDIKIYVSNNDKYDDKTKGIVDALTKIYSNLEYNENETDLGIDGNMRKAFELKDWGGAKYCLMLGDDDELLRGSFDILFNAIDLYGNVAFMILNWRSNGSTVNRWDKDRLYEDPIECFRENYDKMPYGSIICNIECAQNVPKEEKDRFMGTYHLYTGVLWDMALRNTRILRIGKPIILKPEKEKKTYASYIDDVLLRAIPEWYDKLASIYQAEAQLAKKKHVLMQYDMGDSMMKEHILSRFPEYFK